MPPYPTKIVTGLVLFFILLVLLVAAQWYVSSQNDTPTRVPSRATDIQTPRTDVSVTTPSQTTTIEAPPADQTGAKCGYSTCTGEEFCAAPVIAVACDDSRCNIGPCQ